MIVVSTTPSTTKVSQHRPTMPSGRCVLNLVLGVLIWFATLASYGANWYVDQAASGANNGTNWANAWTDPSKVVWGANGVQAGDTLYISGGATERVYTNTWSVGASGTKANRITIRVGQEAGHNGRVIFDGSAHGEAFGNSFFTGVGRHYLTLDGSVNGKPQMIWRNIVNTNDAASKGRALYGEAVYEGIIRHVIFTNVNNGIRLGLTTNSAIHNCEFYVRGDSAIMLPTHGTGWDQVLVYSNKFVLWIKPGGGGPDGIQISSGHTIFNNLFRCENVPFYTSQQHPDNIQGVNSRWIKFHGNESVNIGDSGFDVGPFYGTNGLSDIRIYNNIWRIETPIDPFPEFIRLGSADKAPLAFFRNIHIINNLFADNTNANAQVVRTYPESANAGATGTNNWIANNIWVGCSRNEYNPMFKTFNTSNPSVWVITNNVFSAMNGSAGHVVWRETNMTAAQWIARVSPGSTTNQPAFLAYAPNGRNNNFRLAAGDGVAAGRGLNFSAVFTTDLDGNPRSGAWDIGPFQSASQPITPQYHVAKDGNDASPGTADRPWRTIAKAAAAARAGDTVIIGPGDYDEHVHAAASGTAGSPIIYRAVPPHSASLRAFRIGGSHVVLDGLKFTKYSGVDNTWNTATRIETTAHFTTITNCLYADLPYVIADDFRFEALGNQVISESSDFTAAGFRTGSKIYLGACGLPGLWYTNHDTVWIVASNTATRLWVTNAAGGSFASDPGSNYWAVVRAGQGNAGFRAIDTVVTSGATATNLRVTGNTVSNWMASALMIRSPNTLIEKNTFTTLKGFRFLDFGSDNLVVRSNLIKDSPNILYFSASEYGQLPHEGGGGWFDYQVAMFADGTLRAQQTNIVFAYNWFENIDNQMGGLGDTGTNCHDITFHNNVFVGMSMHFSGGRDGMRWVSNTFYRCGFETPMVLAMGSSPPQQTGYLISSNLFIDCGEKRGMAGKGWYTISANALNPVVNYNMVAGPELTGYAAKSGFTEKNGVNGGNPVFLNALNPLGPDGLPFTGDDGLQVLPNSPAAALGGGALGVYRLSAHQPVAHFRIASPQGWFEPVGDDYDPAWLAQRPWNRGRSQRPYTTPSLLGDAPVIATFDASASLPGAGRAITEYRWSVDGQTLVTRDPTISHLFNSGGIKPVQLTVVNDLGNTHTYSNLYVVRGTEAARPTTPGNLRLVSN